MAKPRDMQSYKSEKKFLPPPLSNPGYAPAHPSSLRKTYLKHKAIDLYREDGTIIECYVCRKSASYELTYSCIDSVFFQLVTLPYSTAT